MRVEDYLDFATSQIAECRFVPSPDHEVQAVATVRAAVPIGRELLRLGDPGPVQSVTYFDDGVRVVTFWSVDGGWVGLAQLRYRMEAGDHCEGLEWYPDAQLP